MNRTFTVYLSPLDGFLGIPRLNSVSLQLNPKDKMSTLKEQLDAQAVEASRPPAPKITLTVSPPRFGNPYRAEYLKSAAAIQEKLIKRGKSARPSKKSKVK
jgi:hypothetical protein